MTAAFDREAWLIKRRQSIGASEIAAVIGCSPYATAWDVWADKTNRLDDWQGNDATRLGQLFERSVLDYAEQQLGQLDRNVVVRHIDLPIASTLDAWAVEAKQPVEAKTAGLVGPLSHAWGDAMTDQVPEHYLVQVHCQLMCTRSEIGQLFALLPGRGIVQYTIESNPRLHEQIGNIVSDWWNRHIVNGIEPDMATPSMDVVRRLKKTPAKSIDLDGEVEAYVAVRDSLKDQEKEIQKKLQSIDAKILAALADAEEGILPSGRAVTYLEQHRKGYVVNDSKFRVLRFKKVKA